MHDGIYTRVASDMASITLKRRNAAWFLGALAVSALVVLALHSLMLVNAPPDPREVKFVTLGRNVYSVWFAKTGSKYDFRVVLKSKYSMCGRQVNYVCFDNVRTLGEAVALAQAIRDGTINYVRVTCIAGRPTADVIYYRPGYG